MQDWSNPFLALKNKILPLCGSLIEETLVQGYRPRYRASWHFMNRLRSKNQNWFLLNDKCWNSYIYTQGALRMFLHCILTNSFFFSICNNLYKMVINWNNYLFTKGLRIFVVALLLAQIFICFSLGILNYFNVKKT